MKSLKIRTILGNLSVKIEGTGYPIIFLPSLLTTTDIFKDQVDNLKNEYMTISIDPPGQGLSERLKETFSFDESAYAYIQVMDALNINKAHIVGNSWGAMIGGRIAAQYPERVNCSVLMNGTASKSKAWGYISQLSYSRLARVLGILPFIRPLVIPKFLGKNTISLRRDLVEKLSSIISSNDGKSVSYGIESIVAKRPDQHKLLSSIKSPVLIIAGDDDISFPLKEVRKMAGSIHGSEFVPLKMVGHLACFEAPKTTTRLIQEFFTRRNINN